MYLSTMSNGRRASALLALSVIMVASSAALAQPGTPTYVGTWTDCDTSDNQFVGDDGALHWDIDADCDSYQEEVYERPVTQTFYSTVGRYGAREYFEYLDILEAAAGYDDQFLYVSIKLAGRHHRTSGGSVIEIGMMERYGFRLSVDPDGRNGILIVADQPEVKNEPNTEFGPIGTFGYRDTNGDVGGADTDGPTGLTVTKTDNPDEDDGTLNGYDEAFISDGRLDDETPVLWVRLDPEDAERRTVEFALDYVAVGLTGDDLAGLGFLRFEANKGGPKDPQNYHWNDKYEFNEAGTPYPGADGLKNVYEVDTVAGGAIVEDDGNGDGDGNDENPLEEFLVLIQNLVSGDALCSAGVAGMTAFAALGILALKVRRRRTTGH